MNRGPELKRCAMDFYGTQFTSILTEVSITLRLPICHFQFYPLNAILHLEEYQVVLE